MPNAKLDEALAEHLCQRFVQEQEAAPKDKKNVLKKATPKETTPTNTATLKIPLLLEETALKAELQKATPPERMSDNCGSDDWGPN